MKNRIFVFALAAVAAASAAFAQTATAATDAIASATERIFSVVATATASLLDAFSALVVWIVAYVAGSQPLPRDRHPRYAAVSSDDPSRDRQFQARRLARVREDRSASFAFGAARVGA